jgi:hypothetical protein
MKNKPPFPSLCATLSLRAPLVLLLFALAISSAGAQSSLLRSLERPRDFESRRASSADPNWRNGNGDARPIDPGASLTIAELEGPGRIVHIWFTIAADDPRYSRLMTLRIYWDGEEEPGVEAPIGDFFAVGHGIDVPVNSYPVQVSSEGRARNCYWSMPFRKSAKVVVSNDSPDKKVHALYYYVDWQKLPSLPDDTMYFHAQYRQEYPAHAGEDYLFLDAEGDGLYVGTVYSVQLNENSWFGEGDDRFYIDGAAEPVLNGTGTEDYFSDAWGFRRFNNPFYGVSLWEGDRIDDHGTAYRWHIADPVRFHKSLKVAIEHKGVTFKPDGSLKSGFEERFDNLSSVAFWYQRGKAKRYASMPPAAERLVRPTILEAEALAEAVKSRPEGKTEVQKGDQWSGGTQFFFKPADQDAWIEFPFEAPEEGRYLLRADLTQSWDYGIYEIHLDGKKVRDGVNLRSDEIREQLLNLGDHALSKGEHQLRFVCVGRDPKAKVRGGDEPGYYFGLDSIQYRKLVPRK